MKRSLYLAILFVSVTSAAWGQSWYGLQEHGLEPNYRNQGNYGTCWAFGTMASVESNLIKQGILPQNTAGLSERDLAWHSGYRNGVDPLNGGGSYMLSSAYFARGDGPLLNSQAPYWSNPSGTGGTNLAGTDPYPNSTTPSPLPRASRPAATYYVRDIEWLHSTADIKNAILTYGAVSTCWAVDTGVWQGASGHWNAPSTYQAASAGVGQPNHSVAIVGWDDNWVTAGGTGAWLIRNSWGNSTQHFGMSYNDFYCGHDSPDTGAQNMGAVSFHNVVQNAYQEVYYHNDLGWTSQQPHAYALNHFTADQTGALKAVSFYTTEDNVGYTVKIYKDYTDGVLGQLATTTSGTIDHEGFHTVDLARMVSLTPGQNFYIVLQTSNGQQANDGGTNVTVVTGGTADPWVSTTALPGQSFFSDNGLSWTDLQTVDTSANFAINGLMVAMPVPSAWADNTNGNWSTTGNWNGGVPSGSGATASFTGATLAAVNLDSPVTVGRIFLDAGAAVTNYTLSGSAITLDNSGGLDGGALIDVVGGSHTISSPVILNDDATVTGSGTLNLSGGISGNHTLTVLGNLTASSIQVDTLVIGDTGAAQAVPEPSTLFLLGVGVIGLCCSAWQRKQGK